MRVLAQPIAGEVEGHRIDEGGVLDVVREGEGAAGSGAGDLDEVGAGIEGFDHRVAGVVDDEGVVAQAADEEVGAGLPSRGGRRRHRRRGCWRVRCRWGLLLRALPVRLKATALTRVAFSTLSHWGDGAAGVPMAILARVGYRHRASTTARRQIVDDVGRRPDHRRQSVGPSGSAVGRSLPANPKEIVIPQLVPLTVSFAGHKCGGHGSIISGLTASLLRAPKCRG